MKKTILLFLYFLSISLPQYSQKVGKEYISLPIFIAPENPQYGNYKTYSVYAYTSDEEVDKVAAHYYSPIPPDFIQMDTVNADFKIIVIIGALKDMKIGQRNDSLIITGPRMDARTIVYDKDGNLISNNPYYSIDNIIGRVWIGKSSVDKEEIKKYYPSLIDDLLKNKLWAFVSRFTFDYVGSTEGAGSFSKGRFTYFSKADGFKNNPLADAVNDSIAVLKSQIEPNPFRNKLISQLDFWKQLTTQTGYTEKENQVFKIIGLNNLALFYNALGDPKAEEYLDQLKGIKEADDAVKKTVGFFRDYNKQWLNPNLTSGPYKHPDTYVSKVSMVDLVNDLRYVIVNGKVYLKNGSELEGNFKINMSGTKKQEGQIADFSSDDHLINAVLKDGTAKTLKFSEVDKIKDDKADYIIKKSELFKSIYLNPKINVYKRVIPSEYASEYYQKPGEKLESEPLIGAGGWRKKYFLDCPVLIQKIENKELKTKVEIAKYYSENCN